MNREERVQSYIESLRAPMPDHLEEIMRYAGENDIPIIRYAMMDLIRTILTIHKPMSVLEIGTAIGFSALYMLEYAPEGCRIVTMENYEPRLVIARQNLAKYDPDARITLMETDATKAIRTLEGSFDLIFMDGPKGQYLNMYEDAKRLLNPGGVLLSDNIFKDGEILESRYAVTRRERTIHTRMREYLYRLTHDEDLVTSVLPLADGVAVSVRK